jgi:hypothetical protein
VNCPCSIVCPRGVVQLFLIFVPCIIVVFVSVGLFVVHRDVVGISVVSIFPSVSKLAHEFVGSFG